MPLPFLAIPAILIGAKVVHDRAKKEGYKEGKNDSDEKHSATINELKKKLIEMQEQREETKNGFQEIINDVGNIEITDTNFFSKTASFFKGYTNFHVYVVTSISYCRYQILKLNISQKDSDELKTVVLGLVQTGFPDKLKKDIDVIWQCLDLNRITSTYHKYKGKLDKNLRLSIDDTTFKINEYLQGYAKFSQQARELEGAIAAAS
jgi:hypothetical protein